MIESMIQRDRYFLKRHDPTAKACPVAADYLRSNLHYRRHKHVRELFDLRNAIAHNHIWEVEYVQPLTGERRHRKSTLMPETHRLPAVALPRTGARVPRTSIVRFNLLPSRIDRTDLLKALSVSVHLLEFIAKKGTNPVNLARSTTIALLNQRLPFSDLVRVLRDAL
jgi:hypothetical protein